MCLFVCVCVLKLQLVFFLYFSGFSGNMFGLGRVCVCVDYKHSIRAQGHVKAYCLRTHTHTHTPLSDTTPLPLTRADRPIKLSY